MSELGQIVSGVVMFVSGLLMGVGLAYMNMARELKNGRKMWEELRSRPKR